MEQRNFKERFFSSYNLSVRDAILWKTGYKWNKFFIAMKQERQREGKKRARERERERDIYIKSEAYISILSAQQREHTHKALLLSPSPSSISNVSKTRDNMQAI